MPIYLGTKQVNGIWLGADEVVNVWKGTDLIYTKGTPPGPTAGTLFDNGWVSGIAWSGNALTRPQYTSLGSYSFANVDSDGYMKLTVASNNDYSNVNHNCHVCTSELITVPSGATKMKVIACQTRGAGSFLYGPVYIKFGLLTQNPINSMDDTNGGQLSSITEVTTTEQTTYELTLASGIAGNSWLAVVNMRRTAKQSEPGNLFIYKVWFE